MWPGLRRQHSIRVIIEGVFLTKKPCSHFRAYRHASSILVLQKEDSTPHSGQESFRLVGLGFESRRRHGDEPEHP